MSVCLYVCLDVGVSNNRGTPKWMVYSGKSYFSMDDLGPPLFLVQHPCLYVTHKHSLPLTIGRLKRIFIGQVFTNEKVRLYVWRIFIHPGNLTKKTLKIGLLTPFQEAGSDPSNHHGLKRGVCWRKFQGCKTLKNMRKAPCALTAWSPSFKVY